MSFQINQYRDFSILFSRSEVLRWLNGDFSSIDLKLQRYNLIDKYRGNSYLKLLKNTYKVLEANYPNEYILKNEFLNKWVKKELGSKDSLVFNEFRIGKVIADLAMFNGISKAFEIKTILDKEQRLSNQLLEYKKIFNEVYIIIPKTQIDKYIDFDSTVGIIVYNSSSKDFDLIRKPVENKHIDVNVLMEILHTKEYLKIVQKYYGNIPNMSIFDQFDVCKELISKIPTKELNNLFLKLMKERKVNNLFFNKINNEFNQICLSLNLSKDQKDNLVYQLKSNII